jgi:hypothetical protein
MAHARACASQQDGLSQHSKVRNAHVLGDCAALILILLVYCSQVHAQENGGAGLTVAYPTSIGLLWPVSKTCALRPELSGAIRSSEATITSDTGQRSICSYRAGDLVPVNAPAADVFVVEASPPRGARRPTARRDRDHRRA